MIGPKLLVVLFAVVWSLGFGTGYCIAKYLTGVNNGQ